jgi:hypothetical protein
VQHTTDLSGHHRLPGAWRATENHVQIHGADRHASIAPNGDNTGEGDQVLQLILYGAEPDELIDLGHYDA